MKKEQRKDLHPPSTSLCYIPCFLDVDDSLVGQITTPPHKLEKKRLHTLVVDRSSQVIRVLTLICWVTPVIWLTFEQKQNLNRHATQRFQESFVSIFFMYKYELHSTGTASFQQAYKQRRCLNTSFKTLMYKFWRVQMKWKTSAILILRCIVFHSQDLPGLICLMVCDQR